MRVSLVCAQARTEIIPHNPEHVLRTKEESSSLHLCFCKPWLCLHLHCRAREEIKSHTIQSDWSCLTLFISQNYLFIFKAIHHRSVAIKHSYRTKELHEKQRPRSAYPQWIQDCQSKGYWPHAGDSGTCCHGPAEFT